jgi:hypothetical protein
MIRSMTPGWLLVETLGTEPVVVADGNRSQNLVPVGTYLRRSPHSMAIQTAIAETVRTRQPLSSITPRKNHVIRTEIVQMTDGVIHGVHVWTGPHDNQPPERMLPGPLKWDLTNGIATDTTQSLLNAGRDPSVETTHGRVFAEDLPTRDLNASEIQALSLAVKPEPGRTHCSTWDIGDHQGAPITVGFVARIMLERSGSSELTVCRAMNWRAVHDKATIRTQDMGERVLAGPAEPGVHRALVDLKTWSLLKWLDEPCPYFDWRPRDDDAPLVHPGDDDEVEAMASEFASHAASRVLRLHANGGGWTPIHVTLNRIELSDSVYAGLLSLRLPTDAELTAHRTRDSAARR